MELQRFIPIVSTGLAQATAHARGLDRAATLALVESWKATATNIFNLGGLIGTLLTIPAAKLWAGARCSASTTSSRRSRSSRPSASTCRPQARLYMYFFIGLTVFGVFGSFTYYLPELFPTRLRGTGAGFCYNVGRVVAAGGPFLVGAIASRGADSLRSALHVLFFVGVVPLLGLLLLLCASRPRAIEIAERRRRERIGPLTLALSARTGRGDRRTLLERLLGHVREQVDAAVAVAPLVVVPADELEEVPLSSIELPAS